MHHEQAEPGAKRVFNVKNVSIKDIKRGMVAGDIKNDTPLPTHSFESQVIAMTRRINQTNRIMAGYTPVLDCRTCHIACHFHKLLDVVNKRDGKVEEENSIRSSSPVKPPLL